MAPPDIPDELESEPGLELELELEPVGAAGDFFGVAPVND